VDGRLVTSHTRGVTTSAAVRERDLRVVAGAICLSALGDGIALVAMGLRANEMGGGAMGNGLAIAGIFICLWAPVVVLSGHVGLLVDRVETRGLLVAGQFRQRARSSRNVMPQLIEELQQVLVLLLHLRYQQPAVSDHFQGAWAPNIFPRLGIHCGSDDVKQVLLILG